MQNKKDSNWSIKLGIFLLLLYTYTIGLASKIYIGGGIGLYVSFFIALLVLSIKSPYANHLSLLSKDKICVWLMIAFITIRNAELDRWVLERFLFSVTFLCVYMFLSEYIVWSDFCLKAIKYLGIIYAVLTILFAIRPELYERNIIPIFSDYTSYFQLRYFFMNGYFPGFTPNPAINAVYILSGLGVVYSEILTSGKVKISSIIIAVCLLGISFMTGKRGHTIFCVVSMLLVYLLFSKSDIVAKYAKIIIVALILFVSFTVLVQYIPSLSNVLNKFSEQSEKGRIDSGRFEIWNYAFSNFKKNPLFGTGWDSFKYIYEPIYGSRINVHNVYIQLLSDVGVVGAFPFYVFFITEFSHAKKALRNYMKTDLKEDKSKICFSLYIQIFFLLYCLTGNPLYDATTLFLYVISAAIGEFYYVKSTYNLSNGGD